MRRALLVLGTTLVLLLGLVLWRADELGVSQLVDDITGDTPTPAGPADIPPPPGLDLSDPPEAEPVAEQRPDGDLSPRAVRQALGGLDRAQRLGPRVAVAVAGLDGRPVVSRGPAVVTPASLLKLVTALAALDVVGPEQRFTTRVVRRGDSLTLVGGGDPLLSATPEPGAVPRRADVTTLARASARELRQDDTRRVRLRYDDSLFTGPAVSPAWEDDYVPDDVVTPITALWVDQGRDPSGTGARVDDPSRAAAERFAAALDRAGVSVRGRPQPARAPDRPAVAAVSSAPLVEIVEHVLATSDNEAAEVLLRHVGLVEGTGASFAGGTRVARSTLSDLDVPVSGARLLDGSGLARGNRMPVRGLLDVLATSLDPDRPLLSGVVAGLPVAGFTGSLTYRFDVDADAGLGWVRAKTGTLTGVHGLAGTVTGRDGTPMLFVAVADQVRVRNTLFARARLDQISAALAACRCAAR